MKLLQFVLALVALISSGECKKKKSHMRHKIYFKDMEGGDNKRVT
jgi:hypothetical protein